MVMQKGCVDRVAATCMGKGAGKVLIFDSGALILTLCTSRLIVERKGG